MDFDFLTDDNFILFAASNYNNASCTGIEEFYDDLNHIKYIKRLFNRFLNDGIFKDRLIIGHLILLFNVFGDKNALRILFFKLEDKYWPLLKTVLVYMERIPEQIFGISEDFLVLNTVEISLNKQIIAILREEK